MPISKLSFVGEVATITMMELRANPGEIMDRVNRGLTVYITKSGRAVAKLTPFASDHSDETIIVRPDGTTEDGRKPLTFRLNLGGEFAASN